MTEVVFQEESVNTVAIQEQTEDWRQPFLDYLQHGRLPQQKAKRKERRRRAPRFALIENELYRRSLDGFLLRCLAKEEAQHALQEVHAGVCGAHQTGAKLHMQLKRLGYYWPTMIADSRDFAKKCKVCQFHGDFIHQPPEPLHATPCSWPFAAWGMDVDVWRNQ